MRVGEKMNDLLSRTGLPYAFNSFPTQTANYKPPDPPFITYIVEGTDNFFADGKVYAVVYDIGIELYTSRYDPNTEAAVEKILDDEEIPWDKESEWIEKEKMYQITYDITVLEREEDEDEQE